jgi:membrane protein YdbS with pleckstrin-like domain
MKKKVDHAADWIYTGLWGVLTKWFRVPSRPPVLPAAPGEEIESFRPAAGFLKYLKLQFWVALIFIDGIILAVWLVLLVFHPGVALVLAPVALAVAVIPDIFAFIAVHLRYDTTWYVMTGRSLRIRRGVWVIREMTFTFENVQNVSVTQGPLQRYFGIADVHVETAGGGAARTDPHGARSSSHEGIIEGLEDAARIRDRIMHRLRRSRTAGLGDEESEKTVTRQQWEPKHLAMLTDIRDAARGLRDRIASTRSENR